MLTFLQNIAYLTFMAMLVAFGVAFYYCRVHGIENPITYSGYILGFAMVPVSFFVQKP